MRPCPSTDELLALLREELPEDRREAITEHVEGCAACERALAELPPTLPGLNLRRQALAAGRPDPDPTPAGGGGPQGIHFPGAPDAEGPLGLLGPYRIRRELGRGSFGAVFEAFDERLRCRVALKVLLPGWAVEEGLRSRFLAEARAMAAVRHDHTVAVHAVESSPDFPLPFLVMEFIEGESLAARLQREQALAPRDAAGLARQAALGLDAAHRSNLVHRDVKPANILLEAATGRAKVADFGLARPLDDDGTRWTRPGDTPGTPAYMSPEQILGQDVDARSDVYSLGVVLYEMLTGARPFQGAARLVLEQAVRDEPPPPRRINPRVPRDLETVCLKCLQKEPARRYESARALADDLAAFLEGRPVKARRPSAAGRALLWAKRRPALAALALVSVVAAVALTGGAVALRYNGELVTARDRLASALTEEQRLRQQVEELQRQRERLLYFTDVSLARELWETGKADRLELMRAALGKYCGRADLVGFEWGYLTVLADEIRPLHGHTRSVGGVAFAPDGRRLASVSEDGTVRVWNAASGEEPLTLRDHGAAVWGVAFAGAERLVTASADGVILRDALSGRVAHRWDEAGGARSVAASGDGSVVAAGFSEGKIRVWNALTGNELATLQDEFCGGFVQGLSFSPDGRSLAAVGADGWLQVWDLPARKPRWSVKTGAGLSAVAFSPDGHYLAAGRTVWRVKRDAEQHETAFTLAKGCGAAAFSPDGLFLAAMHGTELALHRVKASSGGEGNSSPFGPSAVARSRWIFTAFSGEGNSSPFGPSVATPTTSPPWPTALTAAGSPPRPRTGRFVCGMCWPRRGGGKWPWATAPGGSTQRAPTALLSARTESTWPPRPPATAEHSSSGT